MKFNWKVASTTLKDFGGSQVRLMIHKTGMPFFDALRLYGTIDLYVGLREDVFIRDAGNSWEVSGRARRNRLEGRDLKAFRQVWTKKNPTPEDYCARIRTCIETGRPLPAKETSPATKAFRRFDAALQAGIRHTAAADYSTL